MTKHTYQIIYESLKERDSTLTEEQFSTDYLNRSYHYVSMCKSKNIDISESAMLNLHRNLQGIGNTWSEIATSNGDRVKDRASANSKFFSDLASESLRYLVL